MKKTKKIKILVLFGKTIGDFPLIKYLKYNTRNKIPDMPDYKIKFVVKGDKKISEISAASIIAKVSRDKMISRISKKFKGYCWDKNYGYGTKKHLIAIKKLGITIHHRKKFKPAHNMLSLK